MFDYRRVTTSRTPAFSTQGKCHLVGCLSASKIHNWDDNLIGMASQSRSWNGKESLTYVKPPVRGIPTRWVKHGNMARLAAGNIWNHQPPLMFIIILHIIYIYVILYFIVLYYIKYYYKIILLWDASHAVIICSKSLVFKKGPFRWLEPGDASGLGVKLPI